MTLYETKTVDELVGYTTKATIWCPCKYIVHHYKTHLYNLVTSKKNKPSKFDLLIILELGRYLKESQFESIKTTVKSILKAYKERGSHDN